jgi:PBP1b-binding outer membrane lipoprotein LpoB
MILKDLKTGEIVWADEKEIRKASTRPVFGM